MNLGRVEESRRRLASELENTTTEEEAHWHQAELWVEVEEEDDEIEEERGAEEDDGEARGEREAAIRRGYSVVKSDHPRQMPLIKAKDLRNMKTGEVVNWAMRWEEEGEEEAEEEDEILNRMKITELAETVKREEEGKQQVEASTSAIVNHDVSALWDKTRSF